MSCIPETLDARADRLVRQGVHVCLSSMVATLAEAASYGHTLHDARELMEQALELAAPVLDYESAARDAGWSIPDLMGWTNDLYETTCYDTAQELCEAESIEPYELEVFEHWAVSKRLGEQLQAAGERVDFDFAGLVVWARTTTGQVISMDGVVRRIAATLLADREG